jgi:RNA polymerase sigma-70 factor (ECF subfamily)
MDARAKAIEELYRSRYVGFRNALATITGTRDSARDVVQEAFARAYAQRSTWRGEGPLEAWVWRIALRLAVAEVREQTQPLDGALDPQIVEAARDPELAAALAALPPRRRLIVFLRYFGDLSYEQIAAVCAISPGTVAATLAQARAELAETLMEEVRA